MTEQLESKPGDGVPLEWALKLTYRQVSVPGPAAIRFGRSTSLPAARSWPRDRQDKPMRFLFEVDLDEVGRQLPHDAACHARTALHGKLKLFLSENYRDYKPKDRGLAQLLFDDENSAQQPEIPDAAAPSAVASMKELTGQPIQYIRKSGDNQIDLHNRERLGDDFLLADWHERFDELRAIAAFAANGISYDEKRGKDPLYKHLIEAAEEWHLLLAISAMRLRELAGWPSGEFAHLFLLIHGADLKIGGDNFEKARMILLPEKQG